MVAIARAELGAEATPDHDRLADALAEPERREDGREAYPGVVPKAAALLLALLRLRPFVRANAKIALLATVVLLNRNGLDLRAPEEDLIALVAVAATGELSVLEVGRALERSVVRFSEPDDEEP